MALRMTQQVTITCYGKTETMTRKQALQKYFDGMLWCDGAERERYTNIYQQLVMGYNECSDEL